MLCFEGYFQIVALCFIFIVNMESDDVLNVFFLHLPTLYGKAPSCLADIVDDFTVFCSACICYFLRTSMWCGNMFPHEVYVVQNIVFVIFRFLPYTHAIFLLVQNFKMFGYPGKYLIKKSCCWFLPEALWGQQCNFWKDLR